MEKQYYIKMNQELMATGMLNASEKIFLSFLEVLTNKGTTLTDRSNTFFAAKMNLSPTYVSIILASLKKKNIIAIEKVYSRRSIALNTKALTGLKFISKKTTRGGKNAEWCSRVARGKVYLLS